MPLTDTAIRNAKPARKPFKLSDGGGLYLLIEPRGTKLWRMAYRHAGKQKTLAFGIYPIVNLADARARRDAARKLLDEGVDPSVQRKLEKQANAIDFKLVAGELLDKMRREGRAAATLAKTQWLLEFAYAAIGARPIAKITALEILDFLRKIEARQKYETARRLRSTCGMVFRYAIATGRAQRDPTLDLRGALTAPKVKHRAAIIDPIEIGALLRAIEGFEGQATTRAALRLAPLLFVRPGELRHAEWTEFDFEGAVWTIPADKMKMRRPHRVPLAKLAIVILNDLKAETGAFRWLFPSVRTPKKPISENTLNAALRRLGYGPEQMTAHGFRAMAATRLNEMGQWNSDAIERQLAHQERNDVRRAYTHGAEYWSERVSMMQAWSDYLDELKETGKVLPLRQSS
ncbi:MAG: tyrosine-type recombinase/integrase [Alphaproteobacteria bacterium]|nr:tyrosine-type recombinase/integrase [Alphaproteobacteria bacterium]